MRQLKWMADAKREHEYDVSAMQTVAILSSVGVKISKSQISLLNPIRKVDRIKPEIQELKAKNDTKYGMDLIGKVLRGMR